MKWDRWGDWVASGLAAIFVLILCLWFRSLPKETPRLTSEQADRLAMILIEANFNATQTNWTMTITPRTNEP